MNRRSLWPLLPLATMIGMMYSVLALTNWLSKPMSECGIRKITGLYCAGCGGTRCAKSIISGDWISAMAYNPLLMSGLLIFMSVSLYLIVRITILGKPSPKMSNIQPKWIWIGVAGIALFTVLRNIPTYPFTLLAP